MNNLNANQQKVTPSSFYWALRSLPKDRREAMFALYAFCRDVDDIVDSNLDEREIHNRLVAWRFRIDDILDGTEAAGQGDLFSRTVQAFGLSRADLMAVMDGMAIDAAAPVRLNDSAALDGYMDKVASAVGRLSNPIFGIKGDEADRLAHHLGRALQLTNILRDLHEDALRDRLYLPLSLLTECGVTSNDPMTVIHDPNTKIVLDRLAGEARDHYSAAEQAMATLDPACVRPARIIKETYKRLLAKILKRGWTQLEKRPRVSVMEKLLIVLFVTFGTG